MKIRYLNLFCGVGGNRELLGNNIIVYAVEKDEKVAAEYQKRFPNDKVIVGDAYEYLLQHYKEYDFIWASPSCTTHSRINLSFKNNNKSMRFPDLRLYELIIFLKTYCECKWVVENVIPYYNALIEPTAIIGRHYFWSNFNLTACETKKGSFGSVNGKYKKNWSGRRPKTERNKVDSSIGLHVFNCAYGMESKPLLKYCMQ